MSDKPEIGFIGLGLMGQGFTKCLVGAGYQVSGFDVNPVMNELAAKHGVTPTARAKEVAANSDIVLICVMTPSDLESAIFSDDGVAAGARAGAVLVDHSTTPVDVTKAMAERLKAACGMGWVDAPVSGGPEGAEAGELAIIAGGDDADIAKVQGVMDTVSAAFTVFGPVGSGQVAKMVNQILVLNNYAIIAEERGLPRHEAII
ncbi:MAG: NAD(P)-dependent oxidoreductase, partial [Rhodospirillaceae bacterium]